MLESSPGKLPKKLLGSIFEAAAPITEVSAPLTGFKISAPLVKVEKAVSVKFETALGTTDDNVLFNAPPRSKPFDSAPRISKSIN